jgi:hypothetical protein
MNNIESEAIHTEEGLGVLGPVINGADLARIQARVDAEVRYDEERLEAEERRAEPTPLEERRRRVQQRIIDNAVLESPHRHYFVRKPGL